MSMDKIPYQVNNSPGYSLNLSLNSEEFEFFKKSITSQWIGTLKEFSPQIVDLIKKKELGIKDYHKISKFIDHSKVWRKKSRILPCEFIKDFVNSFFFKKLKHIFGEIEISDEENLGYGNIYWRIVRPFEKKDIGSLHRDSWFWQLNDKYPKPNYKFSRIKVWIAIEIESGKCGLMIENDSHKRQNIKWQGEFRNGIMKPKLIDKSEEFEMKLINTNPGDIILFNDDLIHGGSLNTGKNTRVSCEFTILIKNI